MKEWSPVTGQSKTLCFGKELKKYVFLAAQIMKRPFQLKKENLKKLKI